MRVAFSQTPDFYRVCHKKADYDEKGPSIARHNAVRFVCGVGVTVR